MKISRKTKNTRHVTWRFGYLSYRAFSLCLLVALSVLPLAPVFASEEHTETVEKPTTDVSATVDSEAETPTPEAEDGDKYVEEAASSVAQSEEPIPDITETEEVVDSTIGVHETESTDDEESSETSTADEPATTSTNAASSTTVVDDEPEADTPSTHISTTSTSSLPDAEGSTETATTTDTGVESGNASNTPETTDTETPSPTEDETEESPLETEETTEPPLTTTEEGSGETVEPDETAETPEPQVALNIVTNDENRFTFSKDECVLVSDGTFYCTKVTETAEVTNEDRVFAAPDADGDKEIYIEQAGELSQITQNEYDDDAPQFDEISNTLVWHRLIDGRYQIMIYDLETKEEEQITFDRYNNMQPQRFGEALVWQGWVGDDWEIFLLQNDELTMLTDNQVEDITPSINGNHVVWQSFEDNAWKMKVYDIRTKTTETIGDADGGSIQNPRFVLVYDTKFETGDIETRGFDLESGEVVPLSTRPAPIPESIPDPDETPEERALISPTVQLKKETDGESGGESSDDSNATSTDEGTNDLVVPPFVDDEESIATTTDVEFDSETEDLVIPEVEESATSSVEHIPDVIIETTFEPEMSTTTDPEDSQESVATTT